MKLIGRERVTRRVAAVLASSRGAPQHIITALASGRPKIAAVVFARSPVKSDAEFVEAKGRACRAAEQAMNRIATEGVMRRVAATPDLSNVSRFLAWAQKANPDQRAKAANALARAYLSSNFPDLWRRDTQAVLNAKLDDLRRDTELCLTTMVEDASTLVRRTLAETLAGSRDAPRHIITALASDRAEVAAIVLARSPVMSDTELVECATIGGESAQIALARRRNLSVDVATSLAETDRREVVMALIENPGAQLIPAVARRIIERFGGDDEVRDALLARSELPATLRYGLLAEAAKALPAFDAFVVDEDRVDIVMRDALQRYAIRLVNSSEPDEIRDLMYHLRATGVLTTALLVRALVSGGRDFFSAAAAELTGVSLERIAGFVREPFGAGFAALYRRMGMSQRFFTPFCAALAALEEFDREHADRVFRPIVSRMIASCESERSPGLSRLLSLLRRLEAEAALDETRTVAEAATALLAEESALAAPTVVIEPGLSRLLSLLRRLEAESALAEPEVTVPSLDALREIFEASIAGMLAVFHELPVS